MPNNDTPTIDAATLDRFQVDELSDGYAISDHGPDADALAARAASAPRFMDFEDANALARKLNAEHRRNEVEAQARTQLAAGLRDLADFLEREAVPAKDAYARITLYDRVTGDAFLRLVEAIDAAIEIGESGSGDPQYTRVRAIRDFGPVRYQLEAYVRDVGGTRQVVQREEFALPATLAARVIKGDRP